MPDRTFVAPPLRIEKNCINRILEIFIEQDLSSASRAVSAISSFLEPVQASIWPEVNYSFSRLSGDGFPLEFTFSSATNAISYTTEIAGPEINEGIKIDKAYALLKEHAFEPPASSISDLISRLRQQSSLRYGAWIGGRHGKDNQDRYKMYLETTGSCFDIGKNFMRSYIGALPLFNHQHFFLRMISVDCAYKMEYYFRLFDIDESHLQAIMKALGFGQQGVDLLKFIHLISKRKVDRSFIGSNLGFSIAMGKDNLPEAISIFTFNYKIFEPGDKYIRMKLLECSDYFGWDFSTYARITEPIANKTGRLTNHGLVAFSITREGTTMIQVGLRPPETR